MTHKETEEWEMRESREQKMEETEEWEMRESREQKWRGEGSGDVSEKWRFWREEGE